MTSLMARGLVTNTCSADTIALRMGIGPIQLLKQATPAQRRTLLAAALGWMLDAFDAMLYALVLAYVMRDLGMSKKTAGFLYTLTLLASGIGGVFFGFLADRIGRKRALMFSILTYSVCSFASGLSTTVLMLAVFRFILGLGMGGEWNTGATLVAETWPDELRAKAIAVVQSSWAIGYALAALVAGVVLRYANWRFVFFVGILPALVTLWIRKGVPESEMWVDHRRTRQDQKLEPRRALGTQGNESFFTIFRAPYGKSTVALLLLNFFGLFGWWGLFSWIPPYLSLPVERGGWVRPRCSSCSICLACFRDISVLGGWPTIWGGASLSCFTFLPPRFSCRCTLWRVRRLPCSCWARWSLSSGRDFSRDRG